MTQEKCCKGASCCAAAKENETAIEPYMIGWIDIKNNKIPQIATVLTKTDKWEHFKIRLNIDRMNYKVAPGIYGVGSPTPASPVLVTANFKLSFDTLRKELTGLDAWILVLDTKGINVWCAAGKGRFATEELVTRIEATGLKKIIDHRKLIVPQLGAPGVSAYKVKKLSGFTVIFGPVRANDIPAFLAADLHAAAEMRRVRFTLPNRLLLIPTELVQGLRYLVLIIFIFYIISGLSRSGFSLALVEPGGIRAAVNFLLIYAGSFILGFIFLPWLPGRAFSVKGLWIGLFVFAISFAARLAGSGVLEPLAWLLLMTALSSFVVMNFTGSTHYTSLSGVKKEMRIALPMQISAAVPGCLLWILSRFF